MGYRCLVVDCKVGLDLWLVQGRRCLGDQITISIAGFILLNHNLFNVSGEFWVLLRNYNSGRW